MPSNQLQNIDWSKDNGRGHPWGWNTVVTTTTWLYAGFFPWFSGAFRAVEHFGSMPTDTSYRFLRFRSILATPAMAEDFTHWTSVRSSTALESALFEGSVFCNFNTPQFNVWMAETLPIDGFEWVDNPDALERGPYDSFEWFYPDVIVTSERVDGVEGQRAPLRMHCLHHGVIQRNDLVHVLPNAADPYSELPDTLRTGTAYYVIDVQTDPSGELSFALSSTRGGAAIAAERAGVGTWIVRPDETQFWTQALGDG